METFVDYAYYYNSFYQDKDYAAEARQVDNLLKTYGREISSLINFGCGTGRHDLELAKLGYRCEGVDVSPAMVRLATENARQEKADVIFSVSDIRKFEPKQKYDAVISLFHVVSYQNSNQDAADTFRSARRVLNKGGLFLFDVWYGPGVLCDLPVVRIKEVEDDVCRLVRIARPAMHDKENIVDVNYEVFVMEKETGKTKVINEVHRMRYFFRPELEYMLRETGFELMDNLDCRTLGETDYTSWTSYFIAKAV